MYTNPEYRRKGIAYKTLDLLVRDTKSKGISSISLEATDMRRPLYEKYGFIKMNDETEIVHSDMQNDGSVKVYIERPDEQYGFKHATCWLPQYKWEGIYHFKEEEIERFEEIIRSTAHLII